MKIERHTINRNDIWLSFDTVKVDGIEYTDQIICYYKLTEPTVAVFGGALKNDYGNNIIFNSIENASKYALDFLKKIIYPPTILLPTEYTKDNISEIMFKNISIDLGSVYSDKIERTIQGQITDYLIEGNATHLPARVFVKSNDGNKSYFSILVIKAFNFI